MIRTIERKALIDKNTHKNLEELFPHLTELYNSSLAHRNFEYKKNNKQVTLYDQQKILTHKREEDEFFRSFPRRPQISILRRVDKAQDKFFRDKLYVKGKGFLRFKSKNRGIRSFEYYYSPKIKQAGNKYKFTIKKLGIFKFGKKLPEGVIKFIRFVKTSRRIKLQFVMEIENKIPQIQKEPLGIDVGIKNRVTLSNGFQVPQNKINKKRELRLQRKLSRAKKGSNNRKKKKLSYQKECQRTQERENNQLHKLTSNLIKNHSNNFVIEDLDIKNLTKKGNNKRKRTQNKNLLEQKLGKFFELLSYKAESAGGKVIRVNPAYTSKMCSKCGKINEKLTLFNRVYKCDCGLILDRDINASINILRKGIKAFTPGGKKVPIGTPGTQGEYLLREAPLLTV